MIFYRAPNCTISFTNLQKFPQTHTNTPSGGKINRLAWPHTLPDGDIVFVNM